MTDALLSSLNFKPGKDAEVAWLDARVSVKGRKREAKMEDMETEENKGIILTND